MPKPKSVPKDSHASLLQSEERFRTLIQQSTDAIQLLDAEGRIVYSSDSVETVLGYTPAEIIGEAPIEYLHPDDKEKFLVQIGPLLSVPGRRLQLEYRVRRKNGNWIWLETVVVNHLHNPAIAAVVGNFRDITERKEAERALRDSEAQLRFMAESMPQKIFTIGQDGHIDYFNPQWTEYTGMPADEIKRHTLIYFVHPDEKEENLKSWFYSMNTGEPFVFEHRFRNARGDYRWHLTRAHALYGGKGDITMWIGSSTDIHDSKLARVRQEQLEHKASLLQEQRERLMELNKAKDEFISLASHQLRTPATGVKQFLGMILEGFAASEVPADIKQMIQIAYESNERQLKIVNDLLQVAYVDAGKLQLVKESFNFPELAQEVTNELHGAIKERQQKIEIEDTCKNGEVTADKRLVRMVLENLIDNASKYSLKGKTIAIKLECTKKSITAHIIDQGVGISQADQEKLFKKFSRIDNPLSTLVGGTGLGLYWVQQVVVLHKGKVSVTSKEGKGSTFSITIPRA